MDRDAFKKITDTALLGEALKAWLALHPERTIADIQSLKNYLTLDIAAIDKRLSDQVNAIMHHQCFKKMEASWRSLAILVFQEKSNNVKIKMLNAGWNELHKDVVHTLDFDQSYLFKQIYSHEYGMPGGEPYGLIVADYYPCLKGNNAIKDVDTLKGLAAIGAAAFAPVICGVDPQSIEMSSFSEISPRISFNAIFNEEGYAAWNQLREDDNTRYLGLALPRFLLRKPIDHEKQASEGFYFREQCRGQGGKNYLWGNASYAFASVVMASFSRTHWFYEMRGYDATLQAGGFLREAELFAPINEQSPFLPKYSMETALDNEMEWELSQLGFIPLRQIKHAGPPVFFTNHAVYKPNINQVEKTLVNDKISSEIQYVLYASRFAHYIKVMMREKVGSFTSASDISAYLNNWCAHYQSSNVISGPKRALYPLKSVVIDASVVPGEVGVYRCDIIIEPHTFVEGISAVLKFSVDAKVQSKAMAYAEGG